MFSASAGAGSEACANRTNNTLAKLTECVTLDGVREHQAAFQAIADANGGIRASGTSGYDASAAYVAGRMEDAGYQVTIQEFLFQTFIELEPTILERVAAPPTGPIVTSIMEYSGSGDVTAAVTPLALLRSTRHPGARPPTSRASRPETSLSSVAAHARSRSRPPTPTTRGRSESSSTTTSQAL